MKNINRLLAIAFRMAAFIKVPKRKAMQNFGFNQAIEGTVSGCINGQRSAPIADFRYGLHEYGKVGCEIIAAYNALCLLGLHPYVSEIGHRFEVCGGQMLFGAWGTDPFSIEKVLAESGIRFRRIENVHQLSTEAEKEQRVVLILSFWNQRYNIFKGIHTVTAEYEKGIYKAYNRFDMVSYTLSYNSLDALLGNGELIVGYLAEVRA